MAEDDRNRWRGHVQALSKASAKGNQTRPSIQDNLVSSYLHLHTGRIPTNLLVCPARNRIASTHAPEARHKLISQRTRSQRTMFPGKRAGGIILFSVRFTHGRCYLRLPQSRDQTSGILPTKQPSGFIQSDAFLVTISRPLMKVNFCAGLPPPQPPGVCQNIVK